MSIVFDFADIAARMNCKQAPVTMAEVTTIGWNEGCAPSALNEEAQSIMSNMRPMVVYWNKVPVHEYEWHTDVTSNG